MSEARSNELGGDVCAHGIGVVAICPLSYAGRRGGRNKRVTLATAGSRFSASIWLEAMINIVNYHIWLCAQVTVYSE